jgi:hypothetical protein
VPDSTEPLYLKEQNEARCRCEVVWASPLYEKGLEDYQQTRSDGQSRPKSIEHEPKQPNLSQRKGIDDEAQFFQPRLIHRHNPNKSGQQKHLQVSN